jgi:hypothetical protein
VLQLMRWYWLVWWCGLMLHRGTIVSASAG